MKYFQYLNDCITTVKMVAQDILKTVVKRILFPCFPWYV